MYEIRWICATVFEIIQLLKLLNALMRPAIKNILVHLNLQHTRNHDPPTKNDFDISELVYDSWESQIPPFKYWE